MNKLMKKEKIISLLLTVARIVLGLVFVFSGFVKGVDPLGSTHKISDYLNAFNLGFIEPLAIVFAFFLIAAEFLIGISLIFRFRFRLGAWAVAIFMVSFTVLTFFLALFNPVTDCGCFGDAIIMTNWQTFFKNLALLPFVYIVFMYRDELSEPYPPVYSLGGLMIFGIFFLALETHAYRHLPMFDFRPYSVGTHIPDKMSIPEGAPLDEYRTILYYEKNGEVKEFTEENFPWEDTTWKFIDSRHTLVRKGYEAPIHDFTIVDEFGIDLTNDILLDEGYSFLLVSTNLDKADRGALVYADELATWCLASGHSFYCMTSSGEEEIQRVREDMDLACGFYTTDEITLKTIIRSNPGLLLLKRGTILAKWHHTDLPALEDIRDDLLPYVLTRNRKALELRNLGVFMALFLVFPLYIVLFPYGKKISQ